MAEEDQVTKTFREQVSEVLAANPDDDAALTKELRSLLESKQNVAVDITLMVRAIMPLEKARLFVDTFNTRRRVHLKSVIDLIGTSRETQIGAVLINGSPPYGWKQ